MARTDELDLTGLIAGVSTARVSGDRVSMNLPGLGDRRYDVDVPSAVLKAISEVLSVMDTGCVPVVVNGRRDLTTTQAAAILSISRTVLMGLIRGGQLHAHKNGTHFRLRLSDVMEYRRRADSQARTDSAIAQLERASEVAPTPY